VLEADGIVGWRLHQSFWDRRRGLAQLTATTAAGGEAVLVPDVPLGEAVAVAAAATPRAVAGFLA
jgi:putative membrane protein